MKILRATAHTQGRRSNDFDWCVEGELVVPPVVVCCLDRNDPDGGCGCGRAWAGAASHRGTTTAMVRELAFTAAEYAEAIRSSLEQDGWWPSFVSQRRLTAMIRELRSAASEYPVGTVLERRLGTISSRGSVELPDVLPR